MDLKRVTGPELILKQMKEEELIDDKSYMLMIPYGDLEEDEFDFMEGWYRKDEKGFELNDAPGCTLAEVYAIFEYPSINNIRTTYTVNVSKWENNEIDKKSKEMIAEVKKNDRSSN